MVAYAATATKIPRVERKDPSDLLDYRWDWSDWLETGETISVAAWTVPTGLTQEDADVGSTTATVWLSGGTVDTEYTVACKVTTTTGRVCERSCKILVTNR